MAYQLYYWTACKSFWGRAIGVILTLDEAGAEYTVHPPEEVPVPQRFTFPVLTLAEGLSMGQVPAILNVLGQRFGLAGTTDAERIASQEAVLDVDDVFAEAQGGKFAKDPDRAAKWFSLLDARLADHRYLVTDSPTVADFHAVFATEWVHKSYRKDAYDSYPHLARWWGDICAHPTVHRMKTGDIPMIP